MSFSWQTLFFTIILVSSVLVIPLTFAQVAPVAIFQSPKKQVEQGVLYYFVKCNAGFELMVKFSDKSPACVKPETAQNLYQRHWGDFIASPTSSENSTTPESSSSDIEKKNGHDLLLLTTEKTTYKLSEMIPITIKNTGNIKLAFPDGNLGIQVKDTSGKFLCCSATAEITYLLPDENFTFVWNQGTVDYGSQVKAGNYTITVLYGTPDTGMIYNESESIEIQ